MAARIPDRVALDGRLIRLEPLDPAEHLPGLFHAIARPEVFAGGYGGGPEGMPADQAAYEAWALEYWPWRTGITFVARFRDGDRAIVGASSLADFDLDLESAHIGWTAWAPETWGTGVNAEAKLLMLGLAFDHGFRRVKLQADAGNTRSRGAMLRLGATFEGELREARRRADGTWAGTAVYSVLISEWPEVRAGLEERVRTARGRAD